MSWSNRQYNRIAELRAKAHYAHNNEEPDMDELFPRDVIIRSTTIAKQLESSDPQNRNYLHKLYGDVTSDRKFSSDTDSENAWRVVRTALRQFASKIRNWDDFKENMPSAEQLYTMMTPYLAKAMLKSQEQHLIHTGNSSSRG